MATEAVWRLISSGHSDAYTNMAVDEAIMEAAGQKLVPPTLRIYGWCPPTVSLGYFQEVDGQVDVAAIRRRGWDLVRRPTGGRAILHDDEVTYSVCVLQELLEHGDSVTSSYRELAGGIQQGLALLGVGTELGDESKSRPRHGSGSRRQPAICFTQTTRADMTVQNRKIVGSAQVRKNGTILQHGSIPLTLNIDDHLAVMSPVSGGTALPQAAIAVAEAVGRPVSFEEVSRALITGFSGALGVKLELASLTFSEKQRAARLRAEKYATDKWNYIRPSRR